VPGLLPPVPGAVAARTSHCCTRVVCCSVLQCAAAEALHTAASYTPLHPPNVLQCAAVRCRVLQPQQGVAAAAGCCSRSRVLQPQQGVAAAAGCCSRSRVLHLSTYMPLHLPDTHASTACCMPLKSCNTLQHTTTHCSILQQLHSACLSRPATHCNTLQHTATHSITLCNKCMLHALEELQHTATHHCNTRPCNNCMLHALKELSSRALKHHFLRLGFLRVAVCCSVLQCIAVPYICVAAAVFRVGCCVFRQWLQLYVSCDLALSSFGSGCRCCRHVRCRMLHHTQLCAHSVRNAHTNHSCTAANEREDEQNTFNSS